MFAMLVATALGPAPVPDNKIPEAIRKVLAEAEEIEVISLELDGELTDEEHRKYVEGKAGFHAHKPLGSVRVEDKDARKRLVRALLDGIAKSKPGDRADCFRPRHGLRATAGGKTVELVICFECWSVSVYADGKYVCALATQRAPGAAFNRVLKDAKVRLPKGAESSDKDK